jgi:hypothetical protein
MKILVKKVRYFVFGDSCCARSTIKGLQGPTVKHLYGLPNQADDLEDQLKK